MYCEQEDGSDRAVSPPSGVRYELSAVSTVERPDKALSALAAGGTAAARGGPSDRSLPYRVYTHVAWRPRLAQL